MRPLPACPIDRIVPLPRDIAAREVQGNLGFQAGETAKFQPNGLTPDEAKRGEEPYRETGAGTALKA
jgi:hypothetical protein